jgi:RND family efflux transporter MFP subunit
MMTNERTKARTSPSERAVNVIEPEHHHGEELGFPLPHPAKMTRTRAAAILCGVCIVAATAFFAGYLPRHEAQAKLGADTKAGEHQVPRVEVIAPRPLPSEHAVSLPGTVQPLAATTVSSRADGYVHRWLVDIGDTVSERQLLAEIETPELDQQLQQARAQLAQAEAQLAQMKANRVLSKTNLDRYQQLAAEKLAAVADADQRQAQFDVDDANVHAAEAAGAAAEANIRRLAQMQAFARVVAPFSGTVTTRMIERGTLVSSGTPLFKVVALEPVRVFVQVPQDIAPSVRAGLPAEVTVREYAGRRFPGKVARAAGELDPALHTMNTEVRVHNRDHALLPGMYARVALTLPSPHQVREIPGTALYNDAGGLRVAIVDGGKIKFQPVVIERDLGATIQIASGLDGAMRVVKLASAALTEGAPVEILELNRSREFDKDASPNPGGN